MTRKAVINEIQMTRDKMQRAGVTRSSLFGSLVRGEVTDESDVDVLVDVPAGTTLLDMVGLKMQLEEELGRKVDLLTYKSVSPLLKPYITKEAVRIM